METTDRWAWLVADFRRFPVRGADATVSTGEEAGGWDRTAARAQIENILAARTDAPSVDALSRWRADDRATSAWIGPIALAAFPLPQGLPSVDDAAQQACDALQVEYAQTVDASDFIAVEGRPMSPARERWAESIAATVRGEDDS